MEPNADVTAGVAVPGMKKVTSVTLLPSGVNRRCGLNGAKVPGYVALMLPKSIGATPAFAVTWKPVPGVEKTTPRGLLTLKKFAGRLFGALNASGTPSQLISRLTPPKEPFAPATVPPPMAVRNASRKGVIPAPLVDIPEKTTGTACTDGVATSVARPASTNIFRIGRLALSRFFAMRWTLFVHTST